VATRRLRLLDPFSLLRRRGRRVTPRFCERCWYCRLRCGHDLRWGRGGPAPHSKRKAWRRGGAEERRSEEKTGARQARWMLVVDSESRHALKFESGLGENENRWFPEVRQDGQQEVIRGIKKARSNSRSLDSKIRYDAPARLAIRASVDKLTPTVLYSKHLHNKSSQYTRFQCPCKIFSLGRTDAKKQDRN
jgi:hypothetical protein